MNMCAICGHGKRRQQVCDWCLEIVDGLSDYDPGDLVVVTDASCFGHHLPDTTSKSRKLSLDGHDMKAGAGIVVARRNGNILTMVPVELYGETSNEVELESIERAAMLVPDVTIWNDNVQAIVVACSKHRQRRGHGKFHDRPLAQFIPDEWRRPLHNIAHDLANIARTRDWDAFNRYYVGRRVA